MSWRNQNIHRLFLSTILGGFIFLTLFPTLRSLAIGAEEAVTFHEILISLVPDILITGFLLNAVVTRKRSGSNLFSFLNKTDFLFLIVVFSNVIIGSILSGEMKLIAYGIRMSYLPMAMYFVARLMQEYWDRQVIEHFLHRLMTWFSFVAFVGFLLYFAFPGLELKMKELVHAQQGEYFIPRMNSLFHSPTSNGMFMAVAAVYFLLLQTYSFNPLYLIPSWFVYASLLLSISRGGIIAFVVSFLTIPFVVRKWKNSLISLAFMVIVIVVTAGSVGLSFSNLSWIFQSTAETVTLGENVSRVELWKKTIADFKEKPFGYGIGKSGWLAYRFLKDTNVDSAYLATDGMYLKIANETGIWGLVSMLALLLFFFFRWTRYLLPAEFDPLFFLLIMLGMVGLVNVVSNVLDYFLFNAIFWFFLGLGENLVMQRK